MATDAPKTDHSSLESMPTDTPSVPQVSIGMPVYNGEPFIREALDSLLAQTFTDFELIISDNASTDGTEAICRDYAAKDKRIRYVRQAENCGGEANFQFVLDEALGEYFMWAAADDVWDRQWIEKLMKIIITTPGSCAFGVIRHVDEFGYPSLHTASNRQFSFMSDFFLIRRVAFFLDPEAKGKANAIYALYPREAIHEYSPILLKGYRYMDCVLLWHLLRKWKLAATNQTFIQKRLHSAALSSRPQQTRKKGTLMNRVADRVAGRWFSVTTQTSMRGMTDYFRSECSLTSAVCFLFLPLKITISLYIMRN